MSDSSVLRSVGVQGRQRRARAFCGACFLLSMSLEVICIPDPSSLLAVLILIISMELEHGRLLRRALYNSATRIDSQRNTNTNRPPPPPPLYLHTQPPFIFIINISDADKDYCEKAGGLEIGNRVKPKLHQSLSVRGYNRRMMSPIICVVKQSM